MLISDNSYQENCNSKAFVDIAFVGRHRAESTIYIEHNLFHRSKLGRNDELQNTHIVVFNLPVMWCKSVRLVHKWDLG